MRSLSSASYSIAADGDFSVEHVLVEGENVITLELTGEAGSTTLERKVVYMPDRPATVHRVSRRYPPVAFLPHMGPRETDPKTPTSRKSQCASFFGV